MLNASRSVYASTAGRPVRVSVAKSMIPVTFAIYALFAILFCITPVQQPGKGYPLDFWRLLPISVFSIIQLIASTSPAELSPQVQPVQKEYMLAYLNTEYPPLQKWYRVIFFLSLLGTLLIPSSPYHQQGLLVSSIAAHCLYSIFQLRKLGYTTSKHAVNAMLKTILGMGLFGPTATYVGLWSWRENVIYRTSEGLF